ncbi:MAG: YggS family pyridoxal phosphate-dependent enzyme [Bdellovibrionia bacterium]
MAMETVLSQLTSQCRPAKIVAVSKLQSLEKIESLYQQGQRDFAENYVQEGIEKLDAFTTHQDIQWHFIGHLQRNKVRSIIGKFTLIHSVDSWRLLETISRVAGELNCEQKILIQINIAKEESKGGFAVEELQEQWAKIIELPHIKIMGFMTMPPLCDNPEENRPHFKKLRELSNQFRAQTNLNHHPLVELSMGTSHDFKVAIEEGASLVRLGTILFGERTAKV